ncbi:C2H2-type zinc finger protein [Candidatus Bathyarchaeota archaeon]|nr:C2H2-type zinc finger protein [Candidatus Bathyarchaeota archaeon]
MELPEGSDPTQGAPRTSRRRRNTGGSRSCPHCGRSFRRTEHLERHIRTRSSPLSCPRDDAASPPASYASRN